MKKKLTGAILSIYMTFHKDELFILSDWDWTFKVHVFQSVEGEHHEKAVELLKAAQGTVKLVVRYTPKVLEEMESRFEKLRSAKRRQQNNFPQ